MAQPARDTLLPIRHNISKSRKRLDPFASVENLCLRQATIRVAERWQNESAELVSDQDITFELLALSRAIEAPQTYFIEDSVDSATTVLRSGLLQELQGEVLKEWAGAGQITSSEMLSVLTGFERAQRTVEPTSADGLAKRLSDPGGLELVVEVAHDLRSPLTSILFLSETLLRGSSGALNELQKRQLGIVYSAALGLISTASDVVELARGGERHDTSDPVPFSLAALLEPVRDLVQPMASEKGVEVRLETPALDHRFGLPIPLSRILLNLTTNALKFTQEGFIEIVARQTVGDRVEFHIRDSGCGIDANELPTLFYPFKRRSGPGSGYHFSGTGLGLTICRKLVHSLGGELQLESAPGWGTRFFFEIDLPSVKRP
jgi:signal transduction histidine kinase